jgi:hypothetical protein
VLPEQREIALDAARTAWSLPEDALDAIARWCAVGGPLDDRELDAILDRHLPPALRRPVEHGLDVVPVRSRRSAAQ